MTYLLRIYDAVARHKGWLWTILVGLIAGLTYLAATLSYKEDISDFLPIDQEYKESMDIYQQLSEASRIVVIFRGASPDSLCQAIDDFALAVESDTLLDSDLLLTSVDLVGYLNRLKYVHAHAPYFLQEADYHRLDTLLTYQGMQRALQHDKQLFGMPGTGMLQACIASDPLQLFPLSAGASGQYAAASASFTSRGGYMMTTDGSMAFAFYDSPFGSTESNKNAHLVNQLEAYCQQVRNQYSPLQVDLLGAPVIAVGNANRIKRDSAIAILLSLILIAAILGYSFPRKRDIGLIGLTVAFGWLFGMAVLRLVAGEVSVIILGIGSVIIGIVVNYPLHLLVHQRYTTSVRQTLQEVLSPLLVGNLTTIGAFMALIPLRATALRHLGIFASAMLLGTLLFCCLVLPHLMTATPTQVREIRWPWLEHRLAKYLHAPSFTAVLTGFMIIITGALGGVHLYSNQELFDSNLSHINYMTPRQRADFAYFEQFQTTNDAPAYLASSAREELNQRLERWNIYLQQYDVDSLCSQLEQLAIEQGFRPQVFSPFTTLLRTDFRPETQQVVMQEELAQLWPGRFDSESLNQRVAESLSANFDYLGLVCSLLVFVFLWVSFKRLWLAVLAFLPMLLSWVWIFGLMHLMGLHFNIVNIILATFIFGQGDDYTIFMVEGLQEQARTGRPILAQFRQSIFLSALIMLVGIGVLVVALHPAMHSLGTVTLVGMASVVILACTIPPLFYKLLRPWLH